MFVKMGNTVGHQCQVDDATGRHDHVPTLAATRGEPETWEWSVHEGGGYDWTFAEGEVIVADFMRHLVLNPDVTNLPGCEAALSVLRDWNHHSAKPPAWVVSDNPSLEAFLAEFYGIPRGEPADLEETHWTMGPGRMLLPPGVHPPVLPSDADLAEAAAAADPPADPPTPTEEVPAP